MLTFFVRMRSILFCSTVFLLAGSVAKAQTTEPTTPVAATPAKPHYWGVQIGYSNHHLSGSEVDYFTRQSTGYYGTYPAENRPAEAVTVGVLARQQLLRVLWLQEELNYVRKGGQMANGIFSDQEPISIHYLQIPLLLHLQVPSTGQLALFVQGGGVLNFALNERKINPNYYSSGNAYTNNNIVPGVALGGGLLWKQSERLAFSLTGRYSPDLGDFFVRSYNGTDYTLRHQGFTITGGVLFGAKQ